MNNWNKFLKYQIQTEEIDFNFSSMEFDENFISNNDTKIQKALLEVQELEKGQIANKDENRMVGHYWLRNPSLAPTPEIKTEIEAEIKKIKSFSKNLDFKDILFIGVGGSALGPQLLVDSLGSDLNFYFFDNTDSHTFSNILNKINLSQTLVIVVSKSGSTTETMNGLYEAEAAFKNKNINFEDHAVAITCKNSKLDKIADSWLNRFYIWDWVGGRTSLFSAVGLLPLTISGFNIDNFIQSASAMDQLCQPSAKNKNPAMLLALSWLSAKNKNMVVIPYSDRLVLFSRYLQQLVMESIGKEKDREDNTINEGINVFGNKGSTDQHALVQQLRDGKNDFFLTFINVLKTNKGISQENISSRDHLFGFYLGTKKALSDSSRKSLTIDIKELNTKSLAALIAVYERAVGYYASFLNINAYNQPGVEAGKKAAKEIIELKKKLLKSELFKSGAKLDQLSKELNADKIQLYELLNFLQINKEIQVTNKSSKLDELIFKSY